MHHVYLSLPLECSEQIIETLSLYSIMKSDIDISFGARIASLRKQLNISQEELADRCGVHRTYIGAVERGEKSPTLNTIDKLAKGLGISIIQLFDNDAI